MSNSSLVDYVKISPNKTSPRNHSIDTVTIHCVAGQSSVETLGDIFFNPSRKASSNYGIGPDGRIGLYVDESDRSWCSSNSANDHRAVTIEVASDSFHPYAVKEKAMDSLINLLFDICKRNNIKELKWKGDKNLIGKIDQQNMTVHRWFANKACPGDYLYNLHGEIARKVNAKLFNLEEEHMTGEDIYYKIKEYTEKLQPSDYAVDACKKAVTSGIFADGDKNGSIDYPRDFLTREQLAVILDRLGLLDK